jgi:hypothetical protein
MHITIFDKRGKWWWHKENISRPNPFLKYQKKSLINCIIFSFAILMTGCVPGSIVGERSTLFVKNEKQMSTVTLVSHASIPMLIKRSKGGYALLESALVSKRVYEIEQVLSSKIPNSIAIRADTDPYQSAFTEATNEFNTFYNKTKPTFFADKKADEKIKAAFSKFIKTETIKLDAIAKHEIEKNGSSHYMLVAIPTAWIPYQNYAPMPPTNFMVEVRVFTAKTNRVIWSYNANIKYGTKTEAKDIAETIINHMRMDGILKAEQYL